MSNVPFPGDTYVTTGRTEGSAICRALKRSTFWFYVNHLAVVLQARHWALRDVYGYDRWIHSSLRILRNVERAGGILHIRGLDSLRSLKPPVVFIGNHMSTAETQLLPCMIAPFVPVTFIVKQSLVTMPLFGPIMRSRDPITVGRVNPREDMQKVLTEGQKKLESGVSIIVFPQSTRRLRFLPKQFNSLGVKLAKRAGVPVVPFALKTDFWRNGKLVKDLGPLDRTKELIFEFGDPIEIRGNGKEEHRMVMDFVMSHLKKWGGEVEELDGDGSTRVEG